jgi:hypothetical protein
MQMYRNTWEYLRFKNSFIYIYVLHWLDMNNEAYKMHDTYIKILEEMFHADCKWGQYSLH